MKQIIQTSSAPDPIGPYSQAIRVGDTLYVSGQVALDRQTGELIDSDIEAETHQVMNNLASILDAAQMNYSHVVKVSIYLADFGQFDRVNQVYGHYFDEAFAPARETVEVSKLPLGANVEISLIACVVS